MLTKAQEWQSVYGDMGTTPPVQFLQLPLDVLVPWKDPDGESQPFKPYTEEKLLELAENIKKRGVIEPICVRPMPDGKMQILSGHNRVSAARIAGLTTVPAQVRRIDDDNEARLVMLDANLQHREKLLPSEKAFAYKQLMKTLKRKAGRPSEKNGAPVEHHLSGQKSRDIIAQEKGEGHEQIRRYIRLTELVKPMLDLVDAGAPVEHHLSGQKSRDIIAQEKGEGHEQIRRYIRLTELVKPMLDLVDADTLSLRAAVELSYISTDSQELILLVMEDAGCKAPSMAQAAKLRKLAQEGTLDESAMYQVLAKPAKAAPKPLKLPRERIASFFPENTTPEAMEEEIYEALLAWRNGGKKDA